MLEKEIMNIIYRQIILFMHILSKYIKLKIQVFQSQLVYFTI